MQEDYGKQYKKDDSFKKQARLHQSKFRKNLGVDFNEYGNRLNESDAQKNLNYYDKLNVVEVLRKRYKNYSTRRDADMLRSEHIPFNFFAPLIKRENLTKQLLKFILNIEVKSISKIKIEYAPYHKKNYLNDSTSFDTYIEFINTNNEKCGVGVEVKYTEQAYKLMKGSSQEKNVNDSESLYHSVSKKSELYKENTLDTLKLDDFRQIWRNHILGESMVLNKEIKHFYSVVIYPEGNVHFKEVIPKYKALLSSKKSNTFIDVTFEKYINLLLSNDDSKIVEWAKYLKNRYMF